MVSLRAENLRLTEALNQATDDVEDLRRTLEDAEFGRNQLRLKLEESEHQTANIVKSIRALEVGEHDGNRNL